MKKNKPASIRSYQLAGINESDDRKAERAAAKAVHAMEKTHTILTSLGEFEKAVASYVKRELGKGGKVPSPQAIKKWALNYFDDEEIRPKRK